MADKANPWLSEAERMESGGGQRYSEIREMKFSDNHEHQIRLIPSPNASMFPFYGYTTHWVPQANAKKNRPIVHAIDKRCIVCEWISDQWKEVNRLKEEEDMTDKSPEVIKVLKKMEPLKAKKRYDMNIFDRHDMTAEDKETKKKVITPKRMAAPFNVYEEIFRCAKKSGNPSDVEKGYDFIITTEGEADRRQYSTMPERSDSPMSDEEKEAIKRGYDLQKLRKTTTTEEIYSILDSAKPPYDEVLSYLSETDISAAKEHHEKQKSKANNASESSESSTEDEGVYASAPAAEVKKEVKKPVEVKEEPVTEASTESPANEEEDLDSYECKGSYDVNDVGCENADDPCPVKDQCQKVVPLYKQAKELGIDVSPDKTIASVEEEVKAKQPASSNAEPMRRRRRMNEETTPAPVAVETSTPAKKKLPF